MTQDESYGDWIERNSAETSNDDGATVTLPNVAPSNLESPRIPQPVAPPVQTPFPTDNIVARARAYVAKMPPAIAGSRGHDATFAVARKLVADFGLAESDAWSLLLEFNTRCLPPWTEKELAHKLASATNARVVNPVPDRPAPRALRSGGGQAAAAPMPQPVDDTDRSNAFGGELDPVTHEPGTPASAAGQHSPWDQRPVVVPAAWYTETPPARSWLLRDARTGDGVLPRGCVGLLTAEGGGGKTMAFMQLAVAVATGSAWLGTYVADKPARTLAIFGEEQTDECHRRAWRARSAMRAPIPAEGTIVVMPLFGVDCAMIATSPSGDTSTTDFHAWLRSYIEREKFDLVLVDPLSRVGGRDVERDNFAATKFVQSLEALAETGATVVCAHHSPQWARARGIDASATHARGVTALTDGVRWVMTMMVERLNSEDEHLREIVTATVTKSNYSFRGEPVDLRRDAEYGGALVPCDKTDLELVAEARTGVAAKRQRTDQRESERARVCDERAGREAAQRSARDAVRDAAVRQRAADDDEAVRTILAKTPAIKAVDLRAAVRASRACGSERAQDAIRRVRSTCPEDEAST